MTYRSILTIATSPETAETAVCAAGQMALLHDGHLDILALGIDRAQLGYAYVGAGPALLQVSMDRAEDDAKAMAAQVKAALVTLPAELRSSTEVAVAQLGAVADLTAERARFADLVVLPRPYGAGRGAEDEAVIEAALFAARAAVLVVPDKAALTAAPRRIIVAWDQSTEAMAAVRHALPLLKAAEMVDITVIDPPSSNPERSDPGGRLCQMLVRHGVRAEVSILARSAPRVADVLMRHARDRDADLIVMGAYGHSRLREAILGGATRDMLEGADVPVFMAH